MFKRMKCDIFFSFSQIDRAAFDRTVSRINEIFVKAESLGGRTYCESCMACLTAYLSYLCVDTYYEKVSIGHSSLGMLSFVY